MKKSSNILVTKEGLVEKSSGHKIVSPADSSNIKDERIGFSQFAPSLGSAIVCGNAFGKWFTANSLFSSNIQPCDFSPIAINEIRRSQNTFTVREFGTENYTFVTVDPNNSDNVTDIFPLKSGGINQKTFIRIDDSGYVGYIRNGYLVTNK